MTGTQDRPLAAAGYDSYRCRSPYGWIMIGANGQDDAMVQAARSTDGPRLEDLQVWNGTAYVDVMAASHPS